MSTRREVSPTFWVIIGIILLALASIFLLAVFAGAQAWKNVKGLQPGIQTAGAFAVGIGLGVVGIVLIALRSTRRIAMLLTSRRVWIPSLIVGGGVAVAAAVASRWEIVRMVALLLVSLGYMAQAGLPEAADPEMSVRALRRERGLCISFYLVFGLVIYPWKELDWISALILLILAIGLFLQLRGIDKKLQAISLGQG